MAAKTKQRTTEGLRDILFDEIEVMRSDKADPARARAVASLSREILSTARLELNFQETMARLQSSGASAGFQPLALGSK